MKASQLKPGDKVIGHPWWDDYKPTELTVVGTRPYEGYGKDKKGVGSKTVIDTTRGPMVVGNDEELTTA